MVYCVVTLPQPIGNLRVHQFSIWKRHKITYNLLNVKILLIRRYAKFGLKKIYINYYILIVLRIFFRFLLMTNITEIALFCNQLKLHSYNNLYIIVCCFVYYNNKKKITFLISAFTFL